MEEILKEIAFNTSAKESVSISDSAKETRFTTSFNPPLRLDYRKKYEMALVNLETYYSFPNVDTDRNRFRWSDGLTWYDYEIPIGVYGLKALNDAIKEEINSKNKNPDGITIQANKATLKAVLKLTNGFKVDFSGDNSLGKVLGFNEKIYADAYSESENLVDILNVNTILIKNDVISSSYLNGVNEPVLYSFFPDVNPGEKIVETPRNLVYLPIHLRDIRTITTEITDQNGKLLNLRGERITIRYHLREI